MINWRDGKAGFVGGLKRFIKGVFDPSYSVTTASVVTQGPDGAGYSSVMTNDGISKIGLMFNDGLGTVGLMSNDGIGLSSRLSNSGIGKVGLITNDGIGREGEI